MPCRPMFDEKSGVVAIVCGPGGYSHLVLASCPFCCLGSDTTVHAFREVFGGWEAPDLLCGSCGQYHTEAHAPKLGDEAREENKARVAAMVAAGVEVGEWPSPSALNYSEA